MILQAPGYDINIGHGHAENLRKVTEKYKGKNLALFSDEKVYGLYKDHIGEVFKGFKLSYFTFPQGEESKSLKVYQEALSFLSANNFSRSDLILAFGGGVTGDLAGFVASTYLRSIDFISIPTSLLAMVDSSVGGKTGLNLGSLKNQVGSFYFPSHVHIDGLYLETLDQEEIKSGLGEIIKYSLLEDPSIFTDLYQKHPDYQDLVYKSLKVKLNFVRGDERDKGKRQYLNLGHTLGHGIESLSAYKIPHGQAVAIGILKMCQISERLGLAIDGLYDQVSDLYDQLGLVKDFAYDKDKMVRVLVHDKKIRDGKINIILPVDLGKSINRDFTLEEFAQLI